MQHQIGMLRLAPLVKPPAQIGSPIESVRRTVFARYRCSSIFMLQILGVSLNSSPRAARSNSIRAGVEVGRVRDRQTAWPL